MSNNMIKLEICSGVTYNKSSHLVAPVPVVRDIWLCSYDAAPFDERLYLAVGQKG